MKRLFNLKSALWAGLMLFGVVAFTGCSKNDDNNDNGKNNGGFHVDEKLSELHMPVGEWAATTNGSYAIVRNPDTKKTYKVKFRVNAKDGRWIPIDPNTGKDFNLLQNLNYNATDLGDKEHHFYILDRSNIQLLKKDAEGDWILESKGEYTYTLKGMLTLYFGNVIRKIEVMRNDGYTLEFKETDFNTFPLKGIVLEKYIYYKPVKN